jgi:hypothetical protein
VFQNILNLGDDRNVKQVFVQGRQVMDGSSLYEVEQSAGQYFERHTTNAL